VDTTQDVAKSNFQLINVFFQVFVFLVLFIYCLVTSPFLLIAMAISGGASYFISTKNVIYYVTVTWTYLMHWEPINVIALSHTKSDGIKRMLTTTYKIFSKCDFEIRSRSV